MAVNRVTKRGKSRIEVRKRWPDGTTFRRFFPNMTKAKHTLAQMEGSIADGTWPEMKRKLERGSTGKEAATIAALSTRFLQEVKPRISPSTHARYAHSFTFINRDLGQKPFKRLDRATVLHWMNERATEISPSTVNRDLTALKRMCRWACDVGLTDQHLLSGVRPFKEPLKERRLLSLEEYVRLIECSGSVVKSDADVLRFFIIVLGETGAASRKLFTFEPKSWTFPARRSRSTRRRVPRPECSRCRSAWNLRFSGSIRARSSS